MRVLAIALMISATPALAQEWTPDEFIASCAEEGEAISDCSALWDRALAEGLVRLPVPPSGDGIAPSQWRIDTKIDAMTDSVIVTASVTSTSETACGRMPVLAMRCDGTTTAFYISHGCYAPGTIGIFDMIPVEWRADRGEVETRDFRTSSDDTAFGTFAGGQNTIRDLFGAEQLIARFTPYRKSPQTLKFDVTGIDLAARDVRAACGW